MKFELCCASTEAIVYANELQFDRLELCQALEVGGLSPSISLFKFALAQTKKHIHVLVRPRIGNFSYSQSEKKIILDEIRFFVENRCHGIVVGATTNQQELDLPFLREIKYLFPKTDLTFHRAFDDLNDKKQALNELIDLGFNRILTAGSSQTIDKNIDELKLLTKLANKKIEIMIGGGITEENCKILVTSIKPDAIHFSGTIIQEVKGNNSFNEKLLQPNLEKISKILSQFF